VIRSLKMAGLAVAVIVASGLVVMGVQAYELKTNYLLVGAQVMSVRTECFIAELNLGSGDAKEPAYLACGLAEIVAKQRGLKASTVEKRITVTYEYRSPADGRIHSGVLVRSSGDEGLKQGVTIRVHAHKSNAKETKTTRLNPFLADTGA